MFIKARAFGELSLEDVEVEQGEERAGENVSILFFFRAFQALTYL